MKRLILLALAALAIACGDTVTVPYNQYVGITGSWTLRSVNAKPLPSDSAPFLSVYYSIDSGGIAFTDSTFTYRLYYRLLDPSGSAAVNEVLTGTYRVDGDNVRFYTSYGDKFNAAFLDRSTLVEVWGDGHTLIYRKGVN